MRIFFLALFATAAFAQPQIRFAANAASFAPPADANGKIARGSLVAITGTGLGSRELQRAPGFPLATQLGGVTVQVAAGGSTYPAPIESVYASHTNIILPSAVPAGPATIRVTYNGAASQPFPVTVVERSVGIFTLGGNGKGTAVLTRPENSTPAEAANSILTTARAGETWEVWVTGLGAASGNDAEAPAEDNLDVPVEVRVGGKLADVEFKGRAACCPGYAKIRFRVPDDVAGCCVPISVRVNDIDSNEGSISISGDGGTCIDAALTPEVLDVFRRDNYKAASLSIGRSVTLSTPPTGNVFAGANFIEIKARALYRYACIGQTPGVPAATPGGFESNTRTVGACTVTRIRADLSAGPPDPTAPSGPVPSQPIETLYEYRTLDAGSAISVSGSAGSIDLPKFTAPGSTFFTYQRSESFTPPEPAAGTPAALLLAQGRKTFRGNSGADVPAFSLDVDVNGSLVWTNGNQIEAINRAQPLRFTWTGGSSGSPVALSGSSTSISPTFTSFELTSFVCLADASAGEFTVPQEIVSDLPVSPAIIPTPTGALSISTSWANTAPLPGFDFTNVIYSDTTSKSVRVF